MILAQEAADDEHALERGEFADRHAEPGRTVPMAVGAEVRLAQAKVDVLAAQAANELLREVHLLQRRMRRHQRADRRGTVPLADALQLAHNVLMWARNWLTESAPKLARFGILRLVRDLLSVSGKIELNQRNSSIKRIIVNRAAPLASGFFNALRALLLPQHVSVILDEI